MTRDNESTYGYVSYNQINIGSDVEEIITEEGVDDPPSDLDVSDESTVIRIEYDEEDDYWTVAELVTSEMVEDYVLESPCRDGALSPMDLARHYEQIESVYAELADYRGKTGVLHGHADWYTTSSPDNEEWATYKDEQNIPERFDAVRRLNVLPEDFSQADAAEARSLYALITYADEEWIQPDAGSEPNNHVVPYDSDEDEYYRGSVLPDYADLSGFALAVDLDLADPYKTNPLPDEAQQVIETRLERWFESFAEAFGENNFTALDSGGGTYIMVPPAVVQPIVEQFDDRKRGLILDELGTRFRAWCERVGEEVNKQDDYPDELLTPDLIAHRNRQYKTIGSVHSSLNAVVRPLDTDDPQYEHLAVEDVDEDDIEAFEEWARSFTSDAYAEACDEVVCTLWETDTPMETLSDWVEEAETEQEERIRRAREREEIDIECLRNKGVTTDEQEVYAALAAIDTYDLARQLAEETHQKKRGEMDFDPWWRQSDSGRGATVLSDGTFLEKATNTRFGPAKAVALDSGLIKEPSDDLSSTDWIEAVDTLRAMDYDIPVLLPDVESEDGERMPLWALRKAAVALDIVPDRDTAFTTRDTADGETVTDFVAPSLYNRTLAALDARSITHNSTPRETGDERDIDIDGEPVGESVLLAEVLSSASDGIGELGHLIDDQMPEYVERDTRPVLRYDTAGSYVLYVYAVPKGTAFALVDTNWSVMWDGVLDVHEDIASSKQRQYVAGEMMDALPSNEQTSDVRTQFETTLKNAYKDYRYETGEDFSESPAVTFLKRQTERVVFYPSARGESEYVVRLAADPRMEMLGERTIHINPEQFESDSASWFKTLYRRYYGVSFDELDGDALDEVEDYWMSEMEVAEDESDYITQLLVDEVRSLVRTYTIYEDDEVGRRKWTSDEAVAVYREDYECHDGVERDVVVVGGSHFTTQIEPPEEFTGSKAQALQEEGLLADMPDKASKTLDDNRPNVWRFVADELGIDKSSAVSETIDSDAPSNASVEV